MEHQPALFEKETALEALSAHQLLQLKRESLERLSDLEALVNQINEQFNIRPYRSIVEDLINHYGEDNQEEITKSHLEILGVQGE